MTEIRAPYLFYLINVLGYTREECEEAWIKAQKHFPSYTPKVKSQRLTIEVATRDILKGIFNPKLAEVENIDGEKPSNSILKLTVEKVEKPKKPTYKVGDIIKGEDLE